MVLNAKSGPRIRHQVPEGAPYETLTIDKLTPVIGAEIGGIDLGRPLSNRQLDELHRALAENLVIFFRDQTMSAGAASGLWPLVRRAASSSRRAA
jgi:taurine dioxygenase